MNNIRGWGNKINFRAFHVYLRPKKFGVGKKSSVYSFFFRVGHSAFSHIKINLCAPCLRIEESPSPFVGAGRGEGCSIIPRTLSVRNFRVGLIMVNN
jgi:hypothetical protein